MSELMPILLVALSPPAPHLIRSSPGHPSSLVHLLIVRKYSHSFAFLGFIRRDQADWSRSLADSRFNHGEALQNWTAVLPKRDEQPVRKFISELIQVGRRVGMEVAQPNFVALDQTGYLRELRHSLSRLTPVQ